MSRSLLADAFAHHAWATVRLIDACMALSPAQLDTTVPGTYGSILDTLRHLVEADVSYLSVLTTGSAAAVDGGRMSLAELRDVMERDGEGWAELVSRDLDPDVVVVRHRDDGSASRAPAGIRLAQAIHHGTDHRSQVCTALTSLGVEPPDIDAWAFAEDGGRLVEVPTGG